MRGDRRPRRPLRTVATLVLVAVVALSAVAAALLVQTSMRLRREPVGALADVAGRMNVLVVGSDSREGLSPEELEALGTHSVAGRRTDTIFVLSIAGGRAAMLAFPRDLWVDRCDGTRGRINSAFARGGPTCLVETVGQLSGIPLSHYVEVDFAGFMRVVDAAGGVTIHLDEPLVDRYAGVDLPAGCNNLDGRTALGFVRARKVDSDLGRVGRQQRFLAELAQEVTAPSTLVNVPRLFSIANRAAAAVTVNETFGFFDLVRLARGARGMAAGGIATFVVPARAATVGEAAVLMPLEEEAAAMFGQFRDGTVLQPVATAPQDIEVVVRNGAGVDGLAAAGRDHLQSRGFTVTSIGNSAPVSGTVVRHAPREEAAAQVVADHLPGATLEAAVAGTPLTVVLGPGALGEGEGQPAAPSGDSGPPADSGDQPPGVAGGGAAGAC